MSALSGARSHSRLTGTMRQLFGVVSCKIIEAVAKEVGADRYYKRFFAVEHLRLALGFVLGAMHSLRELAAAIVPGGRLAPKGAEKAVVGRSQLCDAFRNRKWEFFAGVYARVGAGIQARVRGRGNRKRADVRAIDGSILQLIHKLIATFPGFRSEASAKLTLRLNVGNLLPESLIVTPGRQSDHRCIGHVIEWGRKGLTYLFDRGYFKLSFFQKLNASENFFITRWKESCPGRVVEVLKEYTGRTWSGFRLHQDLLVELGEDEKSAYPGRMRAVLAFDEKGQLWTLLTNRMDLTALEVCLLYRDRWAIDTCQPQCTHTEKPLRQPALPADIPSRCTARPGRRGRAPSASGERRGNRRPASTPGRTADAAPPWPREGGAGWKRERHGTICRRGGVSDWSRS